MYKILYIGTPSTYTLYKKGANPSHWLYGAAEMEMDGHTIYWEKECKSFFNDLKLLRKRKPDILFIPNLNIKFHILVLTLKSLGIIKVPLKAINGENTYCMSNCYKNMKQVMFNKD